MLSFKEPVVYRIYKNQDVVGLAMSEKLNGIWARWDGSEFLSKNGLVFKVPAFFKQGMPKKLILDGEIFLGYGKFQAVCNAVKNDCDGNWQAISFNVFDIAGKGGYISRMNQLDSVFLPSHAKILKPVLVETLQQFDDFYNAVIKKGGEGVIARGLNSRYQSDGDVIKRKNRPDAEAVIVGLTSAKGYSAGLIGALIVEYQNKIFKLPINAIQQTVIYKHIQSWIGLKVTFSFLELSAKGIPSQAALVGVRDYE